MKKKVISLVLALALCLALSAPALAATFTDLKGHWAQEYIEDLVDRKLLSGYSDGTIRPDASITAVETLALLSRLYSPGTDELAFIKADYESYVSSVVPAAQLWAYDELELCLAAGIVTKDELKTVELSKPIQKQLLSLFMIRAIQKQSEADTLSAADLTFSDKSDIAASCVGSVAELLKLGIVKGDDTNKFNPASATARGVVAAMVSRAIDYLENNKTSLTIKDYAGLTRSSGIVVTADSGSVQLRGSDGLVREYTFTAAAKVTVNGDAKTLSSTYAGCQADVSVQNGAVTSVNVKSEANVTYVQGVITGISSSSSSSYIFIRNSNTDALTQYTIPTTAVITRNGKESYFSAMAKNEFVTIKLEKTVVTAVEAVSADSEIKGEITDIKFGSTITLKLMDANSAVYVFSFDIATPPKITRGTTTLGVDRLSVGTKVVVTVKNFDIATISAEGSENSVTGVLSSITSTASSTQWVLDVDGRATTLTLDKNAGVYSGSTAILLTDISAGDTVTVYYYGSTITEIYLVRATNSSTKLSGSVLATTNVTSSKTITVLSSAEKIVYADVSGVTYFINAATGKTITLASLTENSQLTIYGTYKDSSNFTAKLVVVEVLQ